MVLCLLDLFEGCSLLCMWICWILINIVCRWVVCEGCLVLFLVIGSVDDELLVDLFWFQCDGLYVGHWIVFLVDLVEYVLGVEVCECIE